MEAQKMYKKRDNQQKQKRGKTADMLFYSDHTHTHTSARIETITNKHVSLPGHWRCRNGDQKMMPIEFYK